MPALSRTQRCNLAIAEIRAKPITTFEENSLEARECRRFYPQVISEMLEQYDFGFVNARQALNETTNDREIEWTYAYSLPANMASPIRIIPDFEGLGLSVPIALLGDPYAEIWGATGIYFETPYIIEGSILYTHVADATLEYSLSDIDGLAVGNLIDRAITLELGSRLAVPVKADRDLKRELMSQAEAAWQRALADDRNRHPTQDGQYISEVMLARTGSIA